MSRVSSRIKKRKKAKDIISAICDQPINYLIIHYSCESFYNIPDGRTPRITTIAVKYFDTGQTISFSIHKIAEIRNIPFESIAHNYDELEKIMLGEFYKFVRSHLRNNWIHLNMRDINYGFEAIAHRFSVLGGEPESINDNMKVDIGRILVDLYGSDYIEHPRMETLCRKNDITMLHFLTGAEEAQAFVDRDYVKLHQSTLRKVENLQIIIDRANEGILKTNSTLVGQYGLSPQSIFQMMQESWVIALLTFVIGLIISTLIGMLFT